MSMKKMYLHDFINMHEIETGQHFLIKQKKFIVHSHNTKHQHLRGSTHFVPWCIEHGFNHQHHCVCSLFKHITLQIDLKLALIAGVCVCVCL
jgi:hypothetical protein